MQKTISHIQNTQWLKSPVTEKQIRLAVHQKISIKPYFGAKKKITLRYTKYNIGSSALADLRLDDPFVSNSHALLTLNDDGAYVIEDQNSKNGIYLNGTRIQKAKLPPNGILRIGRSIISWKENEDENIFENSEDLLVADPLMREALLRLRSAAKSNLPILLLGETGTGKEVLAKWIHQSSARASSAFIPMNGALASGGLVDSELFGHKKGAYTGSDSNRMGALLAAHNGTLFLDEVADIPLDTQVKLLRALESGELKALGADRLQYSDFRLITATSQCLEKKIDEKSFRLDLYYRISGFVMRIPSLRERPLDILLMARTFCEKKGVQLSGEAEAKLLSHPWPGNVRELKTVVTRAMVMARGDNQQLIGAEYLEFSENFLTNKVTAVPASHSLEEVEKIFILQCLERNAWSRTVAAKELGIARSTLFEKMKKYGLRDKP